jgi:hypothetical protein
MTAPTPLTAENLTDIIEQAIFETGTGLEAAMLASERIFATLDAARATDVELREAAAHLLDVWPMPKAREAARLALHAALEKDR